MVKEIRSSTTATKTALVEYRLRMQETGAIRGHRLPGKKSGTLGSICRYFSESTYHWINRSSSLSKMDCYVSDEIHLEMRNLYIKLSLDCH